MIKQDQYKTAIVAGKRLSKLIEKVHDKIKIGISAEEIDKYIHSRIIKNGDFPAFLNYKGFPKSSCISFNEEVVHGIPSKRQVKNGDLVSVDIGLKHNGIIVDASFTIGIGNISKIEEKMIKTCQKALSIAELEIQTNKRTGDMGNAIERFVCLSGFEVIKAYCGHGIGEKLHMPPHLPNFGKIGTGEDFMPGQMLAVEPMIVKADGSVYVDKNGWTVKSQNNNKSAHFETTYLLTEAGLKDLVPCVKKLKIIAN